MRRRRTTTEGLQSDLCDSSVVQRNLLLITELLLDNINLHRFFLRTASGFTLTLEFLANWEMGWSLCEVTGTEDKPRWFMTPLRCRQGVGNKKHCCSLFGSPPKILLPPSSNQRKPLLNTFYSSTQSGPFQGSILSADTLHCSHL